MSAMTRNFADRNHYCTDEMVAYYERRAKDGVALILTEGIIIHPSADGYNNVPYIWKDEHAQSWEKAVNRVHECGSKIYAQLWHCGRISHTDYTGGIAPVSSTNQQASGINRQNNKPYSIPRALAKEEIPKIIEMQSDRPSFHINTDRITSDLGFRPLPTLQMLKRIVKNNI